jgi:hypothetical protein
MILLAFLPGFDAIQIAALSSKSGHGDLQPKPTPRDVHSM